MEVEARDRFWQEIARIATGIVIVPGHEPLGALPVSCIGDRSGGTIEFSGSVTAAADLKFEAGTPVYVTFADAAECVFIALTAVVTDVERGGASAPKRRNAPALCDVGSGIVLKTRPELAQIWERPGRGFFDALDILTHGAEEQQALRGPRTVRF